MMASNIPLKYLTSDYFIYFLIGVVYSNNGVFLIIDLINAVLLAAIKVFCQLENYAIFQLSHSADPFASYAKYKSEMIILISITIDTTLLFICDQ